MTTTAQRDRSSRTPARDSTRTRRVWLAASAIEAIVAAVAVVRDLLVPSLCLLAMAAVSLAVRRTGPASLGLTSPRLRRMGGSGLVAKMLLFAAAWSLFQLGVTMPLANHLSGKEQDLSAFADLQGDVGMLAVLLVLGWVLGALVEEVAYRGYLLTRLAEAMGGGQLGRLVAVLASSLLFGVAHSEQGLVGVLVVTLDAVAWSALRFRYGTLWAPILAHGFNNTLGFVTFFLVGPVHSLW